MRKVLDTFAVLSLILSGSIAGAGVYAYLYVTNPDNQDKAKSYVMKQVTDALPGLIKGSMPSIPDISGPAIPLGSDSSGKGSVPGLPTALPF